MTSLFDFDTWRAATWAGLHDLRDTALQFFPKLLGAVILILVGWAVAWMVERLTRVVLRKLGVDRLMARFGLADSLRGLFRGRSASRALARFVFWTLVIVFTLLAARVLELDAITTTTDEFLAYLPRVIAAVALLGLGLVLSRFVYGVVESGASLGSVEHAPRVAAGASLGVMVIAFVVAIDQLGVSTDLLVSILTTLVAVVGLSMGAAFALGARPIVTHILAGHYLRKRLAVGDEVDIEGRRSVVERVGHVDTLFRDGDSVRSVPNRALLEQTIEW